jgi:broad specificity phosphatase PhoE
MREIEIRRHSCTKKGEARGKGSHLSADGIALAREVSYAMGVFDFVLTSEVPRTLETAIAMGYAVDAQVGAPADVAGPAIDEIGHRERWSWEAPWVRFAEIVDQDGAVATFGRWLRETWVNALESVPDSGRVLVISHGRDIEVGVVACLQGVQTTDFSTWGEPLHQCEGVRMSYQNGSFLDPRILRARRCAAAGA